MNWEVKINESIEERIERDGYISLSEPERLYHGVWWLLFVVYGPGFAQYFRDTPEEWVSAASEGLSVIGANQMRVLLDEAITLLPGSQVPFDEAGREKLDKLSDNRVDMIERVCDLFTNEPYPDKLLSDYALKYEFAFTGPRTHLDLWQSKVNRGIDTTPRYVVKKMDFLKEAEIDQQYSTRGCPHCGYPTPDYRARCKRCDYPHGKAKA